MTNCQFCKATTDNPQLAKWYQADLDIYVCPSCTPTVMQVAPNDSANPTNMSQEELDEIAKAKDEYFQRHYSK